MTQSKKLTVHRVQDFLLPWPVTQVTSSFTHKKKTTKFSPPVLAAVFTLVSTERNSISRMSIAKSYDDIEKVWWEKEAEKDGKRALMAEKRFVAQF